MCQAPAALHHKIIIPHAAQGHFWVHDICVNPQNSLGRVWYDNFVMQRGWCLAHRLVASKFTPPTNSGASQNYHTARGVQVRRATRLPQMSLVLQLISNGCSLRAAREIKRLTDALLVACTYDAARRRQTLDRGPMLLGPRTSVAGPWTSAAHRGRGL